MSQTLLETITKPADIKKLSAAELRQLAAELRRTIVDRVALTGGHLASNLGVVELTLALCRVFDFENKKDEVVFDVGHQAYSWKLLTGRQAEFATLRQRAGLSGFPKREESDYDSFNTGHASTSISAALGIARAKRLLGEKGMAIAVIGDGALGGGMAFEALNDAGMHGDNLLVILNDNTMSIAPNVGALSQRLSELRIKGGYQKFKKRLRPRLEKWPKLLQSLRRFKSLERLLVRRSGLLFEQLKWRYYGPIDGHDLPTIERHLEVLKEVPGPKILHLYTVKGMGYGYAEETPEAYHGVGAFDIEEGLVDKQKVTRSFSQVYGDKVAELADRDPRVCGITAAMPGGTGLAKLAKTHPERFFDVGIAEQHAATLAAGLAAGGMRPFLALYSTFAQRAYDQIIHDICLQDLPVCLTLDRAGLVPNDGETHQGLYDLSMFAAIPNLEFFAPADGLDLELILEDALEATGPRAVRYPKCSAETLDFLGTERRLREPRKLCDGDDLTVAFLGTSVSESVSIRNYLAERGYSATMFSCIYVNQNPHETLIEAVRKTRKLLLISETFAPFTWGSILIPQLLKDGLDFDYTEFYIPRDTDFSGDRDELLDSCELKVLKIHEKLIFWLQQKLDK